MEMSSLPARMAASGQGKKVLAASLIIYIMVKGSVHVVARRRLSQKMAQKREEVVARKLQLRNRLTKGSGELMTPQRQKIIKTEVTQLQQLLRNGELTPLEVLEAFQAKALEVDADINAICDFIFEATDWAAALTAIPLEQRGSLYGLPISVKECFRVKGYDATIGMAQFIHQPAEADGPIIEFIKREHGVPFCLTNVPQTMVSYACSNPIYGITRNPHNPARAPGGSSGGEGALIAAGGSILGLGSDIGGSLRIPSHFCGTVALKPTSGRLLENGRRGGVGSGAKYLRNGIYSVAGFMSSSVEGVVLGTRTLLESSRKMSRLDWRVAPVPWQEDLYRPGRKLRVGWYEDDGLFAATPGCRRAVREVVDKLHAAGHIVEQWRPPGLKELMEVYNEFMLADKGHHALKAWKGEVIDQAIEVNSINYKTPWLVKRLLSPLIGLISKKSQQLFNAGPALSRDLWVENGKKDTTIYLLTKEWEEKGFDVVLCPGFSFPACPPQYCSRLLPACSYTAVYNVVGCPVGVVPVTRETQEDSANLASYPVYKDMCYRLAASATKGAVGCPIGVQVVGRHFQEEMVLTAMEIIQTLVQYQRLE